MEAYQMRLKMLSRYVSVCGFIRGITVAIPITPKNLFRRSARNVTVERQRARIDVSVRFAGDWEHVSIRAAGL